MLSRNWHDSHTTRHHIEVDTLLHPVVASHAPVLAHTHPLPTSTRPRTVGRLVASPRLLGHPPPHRIQETLGEWLGVMHFGYCE